MRTKTILIAEDDPAMRELLREALMEAGFGIIAVGDAADALAQMADVGVDLVVLDLVMPAARMDGFAFLSRIRQHPNLVDTPLVIVSGLGDFVAKALDPGTARTLRIASIIAKPFVIPDLLREIRRILGDPEPGREAV